MKKSQTGRAETGGAARASATASIPLVDHIALCTVLCPFTAAAVQHVR
jgi:hypothetical protein